jgi:DNA invertase Pin-like site-specific DNA recombinase
MAQVPEHGSRRAIAYLRVSTDEQATSGVSLAMQETRTRAWCESQGRELVAVFSDPGLSGKDTARPGLVKALEALRPDTALVIYSLSRLARSARFALELAERIKAAGATLVSLTESLDTGTAAGQMFYGILAALAQFEADLIRERTTAALAHKRSRGERTGTVPWGYAVADDGEHLVESPVEVEARAFAVDLRARGLSLRDIGRRLADAGYRPRGRAWHPGSVRHMLLEAQSSPS